MTTPVRNLGVVRQNALDTDPNTPQTTPVIATADQLPAALPLLSTEDAALLESLLATNLNYHQLAQAKSLSLLALYHWASQPHIAAYIAFHRAAEAEHQRAEARAQTRQALAATNDPAEKRRLIALLLRATDLRPARSAPHATDRRSGRSVLPSPTMEPIAPAIGHGAVRASDRASPPPAAGAAGVPPAAAHEASAALIPPIAAPLPELDLIDEDELDETDLTDEQLDALEDQEADREADALFGHLSDDELQALVHQRLAESAAQNAAEQADLQAAQEQRQRRTASPYHWPEPNLTGHVLTAPPPNPQSAIHNPQSPRGLRLLPPTGPSG
jgi:hypothetical protein